MLRMIGRIMALLLAAALVAGVSYAVVGAAGPAGRPGGAPSGLIAGPGSPAAGAAQPGGAVNERRPRGDFAAGPGGRGGAGRGLAELGKNTAILAAVTAAGYAVQRRLTRR